MAHVYVYQTPRPSLFTLYLCLSLWLENRLFEKKNVQNELYRNFLKPPFKLDKMGCAKKNLTFKLDKPSFPKKTGNKMIALCFSIKSISYRCFWPVYFTTSAQRLQISSSFVTSGKIFQQRWHLWPSAFLMSMSCSLPSMTYIWEVIQISAI